MASSFIETNNNAVALLQQQKYDEAGRMLRSAVDALHVLSRTLDSGDCSIEGTDSKPSSSCSCTTRFHFTPLPPVRHQEGAFIYHRAACISEASVQTNVERSRLSAIILYNMALFYHIRGLEHGRMEPLHISIKMYEMARGLLCSIVEEESLEEEDATGVYYLAMAILNNLGQLFNELSEYEAVTECFEQVRCILEQTRDCKQDYESQEVFTLNVTVWEIPAHASAA